MQFLKQKAKKWNLQSDMKKSAQMTRKHRQDSMKELSETDLGAGHQSTS